MKKGKKLKERDKKGFKYYLKRDWQLYVLLFFPLAFAIVFKFLPLLGLSVAFLNYDVVGGFERAKFIGFDAFKEIFKMKDFYIALRNTIVLNGLDLIIGFPAPIILAILLNEIRNKYFKRISQTVLYLPHFLSWVIIAGIFYQLLSPSTGFVNVLIMRHGGESIPFLTEKWHWLVSYCLIGVWQSMGWGTIIYLAAITGINADLYEAATVDGTGRWRKIWNITLPCIRSTIVVMLIMSLGRILGISFERPYTLDNPLVRDFSDVISTFVYRVGLQSHRYNIATAVGLFQSVVVFIYVFMAVLSLLCLIPFIHVLSVSISGNGAVMSNQVFLIPKDVNLDAYKTVFGDATMMRSLWFTVFVTVAFTALGMFLTICGAFALSRKRLKGRKVIGVIFLITMYFTAGTIPDYILMSQLHLINTAAVLILPLAFSAYNLIILRTFMQNSVPQSLEEAAAIDGCNDFIVLVRIVLPLSVPVLATLALFYAVGRWNTFQDALYFITKSPLKPLQLKLYELVNAAGSNSSVSQEVAGESMQAEEVLKSACIMFATIPIVIVYPFIQKYFVKGVMIGAVKE